MKKLSKKTTKILNASIIIILLVILVYTYVGVVKAFEAKRNAKQVANIGEENYEDNNEINKQDEINIEELEEVTEEEDENHNDKTVTNEKVNSDKKYYIKINNGANVVTIYTKDANGEYTVPVKAMVCSTGTATPRSGRYTIKSRWEWLGLFGNVYGHYSTQIVGNILFHSVPYLEKYNPGSLEYWEYDKLGTSASMGCIRLTVSDARWIYNNISAGTIVEFYSSSDPGPLRKAIFTKDIWKYRM